MCGVLVAWFLVARLNFTRLLVLVGGVGLRVLGQGHLVHDGAIFDVVGGKRQLVGTDFYVGVVRGAVLVPPSSKRRGQSPLCGLFLGTT